MFPPGSANTYLYPSILWPYASGNPKINGIFLRQEVICQGLASAGPAPRTSFTPERLMRSKPGQEQTHFSPDAALHGGSAAGLKPALKGPAPVCAAGAKRGDVIN